MSVYDSKKFGRRRIQSGIAFRTPKENVLDANGLLLSAVVTATYVYDDPQHPLAEGTVWAEVPPVSVLCDVIVYSNISGLRTKFLPRVAVSQERGGIHDGNIWKPKATKFGVADGEAFNADGDGNPKAINPANLDGDHVLIGFINNSLDEPVILRALPHPSVDTGSVDNQLGHRRNLKKIDGDPHFMRHHGTYYGVEDKGHFIVNTVGAHDGVTDGEGKEPPQDNAKDDGGTPSRIQGSQTYELPLDATYKVALVDGQGDRTLVPVDALVDILFDKAQFRVRLEGETLLLNNKDDLATMKVGDGSAHATLWEDIKAYINNFLSADYDLHTHTAPGGGGTTTAPLSAPATQAVNTDGQADKITIPAN